MNDLPVTPHTKGSRRRVVVVAVLSALAVGTVGVGAATNVTAVLSDNQFHAVVPKPGEVVGGALVTIEGQPIVHTFNTLVINDFVETTFTLVNEGTVDAEFNGVLRAVGEVPEAFAQHLQIEFFANGKWHHAGTLLDPTKFWSAVDSEKIVIPPKGRFEMQTRVVLVQPREIGGRPGELQTVTANFEVDYIGLSNKQ